MFSIENIRIFILVSICMMGNGNGGRKAKYEAPVSGKTVKEPPKMGNGESDKEARKNGRKKKVLKKKTMKATKKKEAEDTAPKGKRRRLNRELR